MLTLAGSECEQNEVNYEQKFMTAFRFRIIWGIYWIQQNIIWHIFFKNGLNQKITKVLQKSYKIITSQLHAKFMSHLLILGVK